MTLFLHPLLYQRLTSVSVPATCSPLHITHDIAHELDANEQTSPQVTITSTDKNEVI